MWDWNDLTGVVDGWIGDWPGGTRMESKDIVRFECERTTLRQCPPHDDAGWVTRPRATDRMPNHIGHGEFRV